METKICTVCKKTLELSLFYTSKKSKTGVISACKKCTSKQVKDYRERNKESFKIKGEIYRKSHLQEYALRNRKYYIKNKAKIVATKKKYQEKNKEAISLRRKINKAKDRRKHISVKRVLRAIEKGILVRPKNCNICDRLHPNIEGHHYDYDKSLEVVWLCKPCHNDVHLGKSPQAEQKRQFIKDNYG